MKHLRLERGCFFVGEIMAGRTKRECKKVGCYRLTDSADGYCEEHRKERWLGSDERRKSARERGYNATWEKYRKIYLQEHPLCVDCLSKKILRAATVVDHIVAHKGNEDLFWNEANHQALCKKCHDMKTMQEVCALQGKLLPGYVRGLPKRKYLKPSIPVYVVAGACGAGKNKFVDEHKSEKDLVIDLNEIIGKLSGGNPYEVERSTYLVPALHFRDRLINSLRDNKQGYAACWIVGMFSNADDRKKLHEELGAKIYVINTDWISCANHLRADARRGSNVNKYIKLAESWWQKFQACAFDNFVSS